MSDGASKFFLVMAGITMTLVTLMAVFAVVITGLHLLKYGWW